MFQTSFVNQLHLKDHDSQKTLPDNIKTLALQVYHHQTSININKPYFQTDEKINEALLANPYKTQLLFKLSSWIFQRKRFLKVFHVTFNAKNDVDAISLKQLESLGKAHTDHIFPSVASSKFTPAYAIYKGCKHRCSFMRYVLQLASISRAVHKQKRPQVIHVQ